MREGLGGRQGTGSEAQEGGRGALVHPFTSGDGVASLASRAGEGLRAGRTVEGGGGGLETGRGGCPICLSEPGGRDRDGLRGGRRQLARPTLPQALGLVVPPSPLHSRLGWEDGEGRKERVRERGVHVAESEAPAGEKAACMGWCWALKWLFLSCFPRDLLRAPSQQL